MKMDFIPKVNKKSFNKMIKEETYSKSKKVNKLLDELFYNENLTTFEKNNKFNELKTIIERWEISNVLLIHQYLSLKNEYEKSLKEQTQEKKYSQLSLF